MPCLKFDSTTFFFSSCFFLSPFYFGQVDFLVFFFLVVVLFLFLFLLNID